jgi:hypothetical protein
MKTIGGYLELELNKKRIAYHTKALNFNTGRNALKALVLSRKYKKIYIPLYICNSVIESLESINVSYEFYSLNKDLTPNVSSVKLKDSSEAFLYVNYFGLFNQIPSQLSSFANNLIVDYTQAFFSLPFENTDTFYSARKFFGVPDGAYLYTNCKFNKNYSSDISYNRFAHLLKRIDISPEAGYLDYTQNEGILSKLPIALMSGITEQILGSIDYPAVIQLRNTNFKLLHDSLSAKNDLLLSTQDINGPLVYPFVYKKTGLREYLISKEVYIASYWKEVSERCASNTYEYYLSTNLIPLPIDQRYNEEDMKYLLSLINAYI